MLVKWNPLPPPLMSDSADRPMPWEYVNLDDLLVDLKLPPETLEVPVPRYFVEKSAAMQSGRDKLVKGFMNMKLGKKHLPVEPPRSIDLPGSIVLGRLAVGLANPIYRSGQSD